MCLCVLQVNYLFAHRRPKLTLRVKGVIYIKFYDANKKDLPAMYSTALWCLFVVLLIFWLYCVTTVTPFTDGQYKTWTADCGLRTADWV